MIVGKEDLDMHLALKEFCSFALGSGERNYKRKTDQHEDRKARGSALLESKTRTIQYDTGQ